MKNDGILTKIDKTEDIEIALETQNPKYQEILHLTDHKHRPIIAGLSCPTNRVSNLMDTLQQPFLYNFKSYIRD